VVFVGTLLLLPETIHVRGKEVVDSNGEQSHGSRLPLALLNPFASLALLRSPNLLLVVSNWVHLQLKGEATEDVSVPCGCSYVSRKFW